MKKTLLVAAMMASFTGAAVAQNSVTLYGRLAPSADYTSVKIDDKAVATFAANGVDVSAGTSAQFRTSDGFNLGGAGSLWGLRGVEDLGNGLKVSFQFEQALNSTTGSAATASGRVAAVTVSNASWGSIGFGKDVAAGNAITAGLRSLTGVGGNSNIVLGTAFQRYGNQVKYLSPTLSGFRVGLSYSFRGETIRGSAPGTFGTSNQNRFLNAGLRYSNGPLVAAALYTQADAANGGGSINDYLIGGTYDLKVVKVHAAYGQTRDGIFGGTNNPLATGQFGTLQTGAVLIPGAKTNQYAIGLTAPLGAGRLAFSFGQKMPGGVIDNAGSATQTAAGIGYQYNMSKRTSVSVGYSYNQNFGMIDGVTSNQVGGGILHTF